MGFLKEKWRALCPQNPPRELIGEQETGLLKDNQVLHHRFIMRLNAGQDDEMDVCGYKTSPIRSTITYFLILITAGLLRLVFHWVPHWYLKARAIQCRVAEAEYVLITELYNKKHKIYHVKPVKVLTSDLLKKIKKRDNLLDKENNFDCDLQLSVHFGNGAFKEIDKLLLFDCKKVTYFWHPQKSEFVKLRGLDVDVTAEIFHSNKEGLSKNEQFMRRLVYGPNEILVKEQPILTLLFLEVLNPFYIFQLFSFVLWFVDNYYYYAAAILLMSAFGIVMTVIQTRRNQRNLKSTVQSSDICKVLRKKISNQTTSSGDDQISFETELISTSHLVPGDILEIPGDGCMMQCDALLLTGNCIVNESMLTGESVPVTKTPFPNLPNYHYDPKEHARHTLFCGTHVIQTRYFGGEKVLAVVIRTGFSTAKGGLVRSILYPPPVDFRFEKDSYRFVALLACIAGIGFIYTVITKVMRGVPTVDIVFEACDLITIVVPPALPAAMTVGRYYAQNRLQKNQIFCISPRAINVAGSIDCVCFDKTGTLTEDGLDLLCVVPVENHHFVKPVKNVEALPNDLLLGGLVSCHSLTIINKKITGDPLDLKMFESTKWSIEEPDISDNSKFDVIYPTVFKPPQKSQNSLISPGEFETEIGVIKEFPFSSSLQRMGVIIRKLGARNYEYYCKGSPEMILNFVDAETIPKNFHDVLESYTVEGYRVIALAHRELKKMSYTKVQKVQREVLERDMTLLGLIVLENRLKPNTEPSIKTLNEAKIKIVMVTGDNMLTALSVARDCGIISENQSVIAINVDETSQDPKLIFTLQTAIKNVKCNNDLSLLSNSNSIESLDTLESQMGTITNEVSKPQSLFNNNYRFALTGKVWMVIKEHFAELIPKFVTRGSVFARMSPDQKQQLVQELQGIGYYVGMCGDGANDCGALKAAHTGISLSDAESSVASPFTSKIPDITCVLNVIREGRAALVTSFGIFKYMASYSLCQFVSVMILYSIDSNLTDIEFLYIDLFIISVVAFFFGRTEAYDGPLVSETPLNSLISFTPVLSLLLQLILLVSFQVLSYLHLLSQPWFTPFQPSEDAHKDDVGCYENYAIFTISSFQYIILAVVFSKGKPYRKSIFTNYGMIISTILVTIFSIYLAFCNLDFLKDSFELIIPSDVNFRVFLVIYGLINFVLALLVEIFIVDKLVFKRLRYKFHDINKSKRKYLAIERDLDKDTKWPILSSNFRSAASPLTPTPQYTTEIVIETEKPVDSILKSLLTQQISSPISPSDDNTSEYDTPSLFSSTTDHFMTTSDLDQLDFSLNLDYNQQSRNTRSKSHQNTPFKVLKMKENVILENGEADNRSISLNGLDLLKERSSFNALSRSPPEVLEPVNKGMKNHLELNDLEKR
nr:probable cation-transporting ATPase 13A3 isoform X1 [Onthophagus taurus]XP_022902836.1 probable cation-transporting ATPase 13A3 isoform X1 [Onthophagus taurus]